MKTKHRSILQIVEGQAQRWMLMKKESKDREETLPVVTVSREPGSGGKLLAQQVAERLEIDLFHQEVLHAMAQSTRASRILLESLDEKALNLLEDTISSIVYRRHLWPDEYLKHLMKVIGTIGRHGNAVVIGRGGNFIIPPERCLRIRVIAPFEVRVKNVMETAGAEEAEVKRRLIRTESDRRAFVRKYFYADIAEPMNYDLVLNTGSLGIGAAVHAVLSALKTKSSKQGAVSRFKHSA